MLTLTDHESGHFLCSLLIKSEGRPEDMLHAACSLYREHLHHTDPLCTHSALLGGILYSAPALCILYDSFLGLSYLYWAREFLHSAPASCIGTLSALSWLWVSFSIPHSASCIQHVSHSCSFGPASAFCILHLHPASGAVHSFGADSAFCICILHRVPVHSFGADSAFCILHLHPVRGGNLREHTCEKRG